MSLLRALGFSRTNFFTPRSRFCRNFNLTNAETAKSLKQMKFALRSSLRLVVPGLRCYQRSFSAQKNDDQREDGGNDVKETPVDDLTEPTNCCMSGCANCVWIQYAERLSSTIDSTSDVNLQTAILERVQDPNMRAFLTMELRCRKLIK
ncbi:PREDICTED: uncharacterized protein LOC106747639 [Dinoponera quadriceps]|uniref:Uncharacterized protein LOC106747639 n=1 Tax=Dinoponera quadriceps TaxID=609295 RepID=A0A6P3XQQ2_DINQU|nr:PREDICTED: uncharacterized protein LOC106747639 [Dinoponera quadriceps]